MPTDTVFWRRRHAGEKGGLWRFPSRTWIQDRGGDHEVRGLSLERTVRLCYFVLPALHLRSDLLLSA